MARGEPQPSADSSASPEHALLWALLLCSLVWAPVPIGSNRTWSVAVLQVAFLGLAGLLALGQARRPFDPPVSLRHSVLPLSILSAWAFYPLVQLVPLPAGILSLLGGGVHASYADIPGDGYAYISLDRGATLSGFLWHTSLAALLFGVLALVTTRRRVRTLLLVMFLVGFAEATYGLMLYFGGDALGLWNPGYIPGALSGTYVNQNHFAGLMELTIPVGLGLLLYIHESRGPRSGRALDAVLTLVSGQSGFVMFGLVVMSAALILTTSRGGIGALIVGIGAAVLLAIAKRGRGAREGKLGILAGVLVVIALFWIGPGQLPEKIREAGLASHRDELRETSYQMIADSPLFGTGVGTYRWVFPRYKDERYGGNFYEHAHNDFLEVLGEQGFVGFGLLSSALVLIFLRLMRAYGRSRDPLIRGATFAAIAGCGSLLVHGFVDFNLQIPANAAYFTALLGVGLVAYGLESPTDSTPGGTRG